MYNKNQQDTDLFCAPATIPKKLVHAILRLDVSVVLAFLDP